MENGYHTSQFTIPVPQTLNRADFLAIWQETNPEIGIILIGLDSTLPLHTHGKILMGIQQTVNSYFDDDNFTNPIGTFENCLKKFNENFKTDIGEQISWTRKVNLTIALLLEKDLHFANYGHNRLLLIKQHQVVDIIKSMSVDSQIAGKKIFDQIYSGPVDKFFRVILCNQATFDYISQDKLKSIFSLLPIKNIGEEINLLSGQAKKNQTIGGVILTLQKSFLPVEPALDSDRPSQKSIDNLISTSQKTLKLLRPQILPDLSRFLHPLKNWRNEKNLKQPLEKKSILPYKKFDSAKRSLIDFGSKSTNLLKKVQRQQRSIFDFFTNLPHNLKFYFKTFKAKILGLPKSSRYLLLLALILLTLLTVNLFSLGLKKHSQNQSAYYQSLLQQINQLHDQAQATIIYGDNEQARKLLRESLNIISSLPKNNDDRQTQYDTLLSKNNDLMDRANKLTNIPSPIELITLSQFDNNLKAKGIDIVNNKVAVLSQEKITTINTKNNEINSFDLTEISADEPQFLLSWDNLVLIYTKAGQIIKYDPENNGLSITQSNLPNKNENILAATSFGQRLYFLDNTGQIWRLDKQGNDFSYPIGWLKEKIDITTAIDLAIDGNIYVLNKNGSIIKFTRGEIVSLNIENIEPDLTNATKIFTGPDIPYLYLLDPTNQRLIIFDNEGHLIKQYKSNKFLNLKDFIVDYKAENDKSIVYLLSENIIYQIVIDE